MKTVSYIECAPNGHIVACGSAFVSELSQIHKQEKNSILIEIATPQTSEKHYWNGTKIVEKPVPPTEGSTFNYATKQWDVDLALVWAKIRIKRSALLSDTDWLVTKAVETGVPMEPQWIAYRQALRDLTNQPNPLALVWPKQPV